MPPSEIAKSLSTARGARDNGVFTSDQVPQKNKRKRKNDTDDTPKAFARLMMFQQGKKLPKALDDGIKPTKKQKKAENAAKEGKTAPVIEEKAVMPTIRPGEKLSDFSARVDAALPIAGLINKSGKNGKDPLGLKVGKTKTEKRMHRMYAEWRVEEEKIQDKRQEALEIAEEEQLDENGKVKVSWKMDDDNETTTSSKKKKGKGKKKKAIGEIDDGDDDPWAILKAKRGEGPNKISDVYQAPPTFTKIPKEKFKVRGARVEVDDVPRAAGSLRRREELGEVRKSVVEAYREMMQKNREAGAAAAAAKRLENK